MEFPIESYLTEIMNSFQVKYEDIKKKSMGRLKHEEREKDERLTRPSDPFYNKPVEYAIAIYSYYECFKCKVRYFDILKITIKINFFIFCMEKMVKQTLNRYVIFLFHIHFIFTCSDIKIRMSNKTIF